MKGLSYAARTWVALGVVAFAGAQNNFAAEAPRVSRVLKEAKLEAAGGAMRPARTGDVIPEGTTLRTGADARVEVTLPGQGVARLGGKTAFTIGGNGRELELREGLALFQVPRSAQATKIKTGTLNVAVRGTGLIERNSTAYVKILVLEGEARVYTSRLGESVVVSPGQLMITNPAAQGLPEPVHFAIENLARTSLLMNADFAPLASRAAIERAMQKQKSDRQFIPTNLVIYGRGTLVNLVPPKPALKAGRKP